MDTDPTRFKQVAQTVGRRPAPSRSRRCRRTRSRSCTRQTFLCDATRREQQLVLELLDACGVDGDGRMQDLERDDVARLAIARAVDDPHPSAPEFAVDVVARPERRRSASGSRNPTVGSSGPSTRVSDPFPTTPPGPSATSLNTGRASERGNWGWSVSADSARIIAAVR